MTITAVITAEKTSWTTTAYTCLCVERDGERVYKRAESGKNAVRDSDGESEWVGKLVRKNASAWDTIVLPGPHAPKEVWHATQVVFEMARGLTRIAVDGPH